MNTWALVIITWKAGAFQANGLVTGRKNWDWQAEALRQDATAGQSRTAKQTESITPTEAVEPPAQKSETNRRRIEIPPKQNTQKSKGMRV